MGVQKHGVQLLQSHMALQHLVGKQKKEVDPGEMVHMQDKRQWKALLFPYGKSSNLFMYKNLSWYQILLNAPPLLTTFTMVTKPLHKLEFLPSFFWYGKPYHNHSRRSGDMALCGSEWLLWNHKGFSWNPSTLMKLGLVSCILRTPGLARGKDRIAVVGGQQAWLKHMCSRFR